MMNRRNLLAGLLAAPALSAARSALAHHGWGGFDDRHPIYLEGKVMSVKWQNPHVELELRLPEVLKLPLDLESRAIPAQTAPVDAKALLAKTVLPKRKDPKWEVELAPLSRMDAWKVPEIKPGTSLGVVGYTFAEEKGEAILRAEFLFLDDKAYALRSGPA